MAEERRIGMKDELIVRDSDIPAIADDFLIAIADQAERRIDAVIKIKKCALKVTNAQDWVDQQGRPYLQASGAEKIANLFNISWSFLTPEPLYEEDPDGHYTYSYQGRFTLGSRSIEVEGSRSSKDGFFSQYDYPEQGPRTEKNISDRNNKRDVKMAALTNLLGNGISRILGIRNLTYNDLLEFAGIRLEDIGKVAYKNKGETKSSIQAPQSKSAKQTEKPVDQTGETREKINEDGSLVVIATIEEISSKSGISKDKKTGKDKPWTLYGIKADGIWYNTFDKKITDDAQEVKGRKVELQYIQGTKSKDLKNITLLKEPEPSKESLFDTPRDIPTDCTKDPGTCEHSSYDSDGNAGCIEGKPCKYYSAANA